MGCFTMRIILNIIIIILLTYEYKTNKKLFYIPIIVYSLMTIIDTTLKYTAIFSKVSNITITIIQFICVIIFLYLYIKSKKIKNA